MPSVNDSQRRRLIANGYIGNRLPVECCCRCRHSDGRPYVAIVCTLVGSAAISKRGWCKKFAAKDKTK